MQGNRPFFTWKSSGGGRLCSHVCLGPSANVSSKMMVVGISNIPTLQHCTCITAKGLCDNFFTLAYLIVVALNLICLSKPGKKEYLKMNGE